MSRIRVAGADVLIKKLKRNAKLTDVKDVIRLNGSEMQRKAKQNAPVDTSNLRRMIVIEIKDGGFTVNVASTAEYAAYQEYGTRFQTGKAHIRPAFNDQKDQFKNDLNRLMK